MPTGTKAHGLAGPIILFLSSLTLAAPATLTSPNGDLKFTIDTVETGQLVYSITYKSKPLLHQSSLRLDLENQKPLGPEVRITKTTPSSNDSTYHLIAAKTNPVRDHYNAVSIDVEEPGDNARKFTIEARAYDDAIAFRYVIPEQPNLKEFRLAQEHTEFNLAKDATCYALELPNFLSMYESEYLKLPISAMANQGGVSSSLLIGCPLLMEVPGTAWLAITEADLETNAAMYLTNPAGSWQGHILESRIAPSQNKNDPRIVGPLPHHTAWRVILIASEPGKLIESNVITSLNPESKIQDTSWIHPGKSAWDWWSGSVDANGKTAFTTDNMKRFVDFAAKSGFEYMLVDAGWSVGGWADADITKMNGKIDIPALVEYAKGKNVKIWIWCHWLPVDKQMTEAFPLYEKWGVAGVKIDFMSRDDQYVTNWYYRTAELAAKHHLMLDFHGATKPTGMERTWPNIMGYEAVLGMEQSKAGARDNPDNHLMLPFTRMLTGPMDYTPGGFRNVTRANFESKNVLPVVMGTRAHHLAMYVTYFAPFQMVSDAPQAYENDPSFQFIKDCPTTWDETHVINGIVGQYIAIARRKGDDWYVGVMNAGYARELIFPLKFLSPGPYTAETYSDTDDSSSSPQHVNIESKTFTSNDQLHLYIQNDGGYAAHFHVARATSP
jgi:alpha-glucosidase